MKYIFGKYPEHASLMMNEYKVEYSDFFLFEKFPKLRQFIITFMENWNYALYEKSPLGKYLDRFVVNLLRNTKQKIVVRIDPHDVWNVDATLGNIIHPLLLELKAKKHGAPHVEFEDVPEHLRPSPEQIEKAKEDGDVDDLFFDRWDWVMDEMIFAFSCFTEANADWESQFYAENNNGRYDYDGMRKQSERIRNGTLLFGKYFSSLWD